MPSPRSGSRRTSTSTPGGTTTAQTSGRSSSRYFFGRRGADRTRAPFRRSRNTSERFGSGISSAVLGSFCLGSRLSAMPDPAYRPEQPSLVNVRRKLDRAEEKLDLLEPEVFAYNNGDFHSVPRDPEQEGEWFIVRINIAEPPDQSWGLLVSEFLHLTRSALDNLVWQLVLANDAVPWCRNQFPIYTKAGKPSSARRLAGMLRGVSPDHAALIKELQPYTGG